MEDVPAAHPFDQIQCADLRRWGGDCNTPGWRTVADSIAALTGEERSVATSVPPTGPNRRTLLLAGGTAAVLGHGGFAIWRNRQPSMSPEAKLLRGLWKDERFAALVRRAGLADYWQRSGSRPDYLSS